jgi:DNA-directed RNA polymerase specialized sigma24 family protein
MLAATSSGPCDHVSHEPIDFDYELTRGFAAGYVRRQATQLAHTIEHACRQRASVDDLAQQLTLHLLERLPQFDRSQGCFVAFVKLVVGRSAADIRRRTRAQKRGERTLSLETLAASGGEPELSEALRLGDTGRSTGEAGELAADVASLMDRLPRRLRRIAQLLARHSATTVRRKLHLSRKKFASAVGELQQRFRAGDLHEYLGIADTP